MEMNKVKKNEATPVKGAASIIKVLRVLQTIPQMDKGATAKRIQEAMDLPRPTIYRLLNTLEQEGFVERNPVNGEYVLGTQLIFLSQRAVLQHPLQERVRATLRAIGETTGETVHLGIPYGTHMTFVDKIESSKSVRMASYIGMPVPMHSTSVGKAYLAALDDATREQYLPRLTLSKITSRTLNTLEALREELARTQLRGYAIDDEENESGIVCFAQAIHGVDGQIAGAISVSTPRYRLTKGSQANIVESIRKNCREAGLLG
tara:strand:+ start:21342 stop:22127 length:786 start_codon:yes stop_codon:yes gene_type:complete